MKNAPVAPRKIAIIDIGSNSVRMVIFDAGEIRFNEKELCSLGKTIPATGRLYEEGIEKALLTLKNYMHVVYDEKVETIIAVATAALRDATDGPDFIAHLKQHLKLDVKIITGDEEAYYASLGVMAEAPNAKGVVADLGGGSLECARIANNTVYERVSLPLGAQRLIAYGPDAPDKTKEYLARLPATMMPTQNLYVIGGSWRALANALLDEEKMPRSAFVGLTLPAQRVLSFAERVARMDVERLVRNYKIEAGRAALLPVSAQLLIDVVGKLQAETIIISKAGIRDGIYHDFIRNGKTP